MRAGDFWVVRTAVAYGLRGGAMRARASSFSAVLGQNRSLRHPHSRAGGELDIGSHAGARPEPKCAFVSHAASDVMQRPVHTRGVCIERALSRTQGEQTASASEQTIGCTLTT